MKEKVELKTGCSRIDIIIRSDSVSSMMLSTLAKKLRYLFYCNFN
jgi:hypothetical protein